MALGTPVAAATAYSASGGTTVSPAYPAGILATDVVLLFVGQKPTTTTGGTVTTPTGWTLRDELTGAGGYTAQGADTGNTNLRVYSWNSVVAGQTGTLAVTIGGNDITWAFMVRIPKGTGAAEFGSADGQRTTTPTSPMSIALTNGASATNFQTGDRAIWAMCIPTDVTTPNQFSAQSITASGATFGTAAELNEPDSQTGNDIGGYSAWASVTSGSSTTAPTVTVTLTGTLTNVRGPVVLLRVREGAAAQTLTPALFTNTNTFHNPTVTRGTVTLTPALYTNDQTFYSADVTQGGGTQALTASLYTNDQTFYGPTVTRSNTLAPSLYTNDQTFYAPAVSSSVTLTPGLYSNAQTFYGPTASAFNTLAPGLYTGSQTFYSAAVSQTGGVQTLLPDLYENAPVVYAPTVGRGAVNLAPSLYSNEQTLYAPSVAAGAVTLAPSLYTGAQTFYAAAVTQGGTTQALVCDDYVASDYVEGGFVAFTAFGQSVFFGAEITAPRVAGGYDDDKPSKPKPRRFIQKRGDKLIVTTDASAALAAAEATTATAAEAETAPQAVAEPVAQEISLAEIRAVAAQYQQQAQVLQMFRQRDWAEMVALYEALKRQQDEDDIEMLLLSL